MATYEEVSNTLSELEKKVLNHYNVAKVSEALPWCKVENEALVLLCMLV